MVPGKYLRAVRACQRMKGKKVDRCWQALAGWLWPPVCLLCGQRGQSGLDLCAGCQGDLPANAPACERCAGPLPAGAATGWCARCQRHAPPFASCRVPLRYQYPVDRMIQGLKYQRQLAMGRVLGSLLARHVLANAVPLPEIILPVPLGPARYRRRGFNQARELALPVGVATGVPVRSDVLVRQRETTGQAGLDRQSRRRNVRDAFALTRPITAQHVVVMDDVVTTTSTVAALAQLLRDNGVQRVDVWAVARAVRH